MKAIVVEQFQKQPKYITVKDPTPSENGAVIRVKATGLCRSDWHGWMGHDKDIILPHIPGHEFAGEILEIGKNVKKWRVGDRVTVPFVCGCGTCPQCNSGNQQICDKQFQPGFTHWGSFAEYVSIENADLNVVALPDSVSFNTAASLGCRFATSFRAVVQQGRVSGGQFVAVHGCGGVGLSAIMIANAFGANVIAVDIDDEKLAFAQALGASLAINSNKTPNFIEQIKDYTQGGVHISLDALGSPATCFNSIYNLRKRGKHIQVGLMLAEHKHPNIPMDIVIADELEIYGSHGMAVHTYPLMMQMIRDGKLQPERLIGKTINLQEVVHELPQMNEFKGIGVTIVDSF